MKLLMNRYRFDVSENKVTATSVHSGKPVVGVAKCDPEDEFLLEAGKHLAAARCNEKVYKKRMKQAYKKLEDAIAAHKETQHRIDKAYRELRKARTAYDSALSYTYRVKNSL